MHFPGLQSGPGLADGHLTKEQPMRIRTKFDGTFGGVAGSIYVCRQATPARSQLMSKGGLHRSLSTGAWTFIPAYLGKDEESDYRYSKTMKPSRSE